MKVDFDKQVSIDKSHFIEVWENSGFAHVLVLRPHGFGKSIFTDLLDNYYDHSKSADFDRLYGGSYIAEHPTKNKNNYRVLRMSFENLKGCEFENFKKVFSENVISSIKKFIKNNPDLDYKLDENFMDAPDFLFTSLCMNFTHQFPSERIFLIVEDYDNFAYDVLFHNKTELCDLDFVNDFYSAIKSELNIAIGRTFITGVFPVSFGNLFDGVNAITNYTTYKNYHNIVGFNKSELEKFLDDRITSHGTKSKVSKNAKQLVKSKEQLLEELKNVAGGFVFSPYSSESLYNSRSCEYYLQKEFAKDGHLESERTVHLNRLSKLLDLSGGVDIDRVVKDICEGKKVKLRSISNFLRLTLVKNYNQDEILSLLFYLGYLTIDPNSIKTVGTPALVCPNNFRLDMFKEYNNNKLNGFSSDDEI